MSQTINLKQMRTLTLGSGCKLAFIKHTENIDIVENGITHTQKIQSIKPVLILIGINKQGEDGARVSSYAANGCVGIITSQLNENNQLDTHFKTSPIILNPDIKGIAKNDWLTLDKQKDKIVFPRIFINSLQIKVDSDSLVVKYEDYNNVLQQKPVNYTVLKPYEDYSILTRSLQKKYAITLDSEMVIKNGVLGSYTGVIEPRNVLINYSISNADTSIYLDAIQILKQNSVPKVSYEIKPNIFNSQYCETLYNKLGNIIRINDTDLKFKNVLGYISGLTLDLDNPDQDNVEVKNYKTKFEDLFSTITAQTQQMKKNNTLIQNVASAFTATGDLSEQVLQSSIMKVDLNYAFNNGKLTIDEHNGIWGTSDNGVVAFRGGGIFTSTEKTSDGEWKWNTGITPEGINANLITTGQLDTNLIKIYSGDNLRFQMNGDGIFAYKSILTDSSQNKVHPQIKQELEELQIKASNHTITQKQQERLEQLQNAMLSAEQSLDGKQYVLFNQEGLSLIAKKGAKVLNKDKTNYILVLDDAEINQLKDTDITTWRQLKKLEQIKRVEVGWDGFILRNWQNQKVFYAEPDTGNLVISGTINATSGHIGTWIFDNNAIWSPAGVDENDGTYTQFVALNAGGGTEVSFTDKNGNPLYQYENGAIKIDNNGDPVIKTVDTKDYAFWAGNIDPIAAAFSIKKNGAMKATNGEIGGWIITSNRLSSNIISLASTASGISVDDHSYTINSETNQSSTIDNGTVQHQAALWVHGSNNNKNANHALLYINSTGNLYAKQLYFLYHKNDGTINYSTSVKTLIETAQKKADNAWNKAVSAINKIPYGFYLSISDGNLKLNWYINGTHYSCSSVSVK